MENQKRKFCKLQGKETIFVRHHDDANRWVCTECPYQFIEKEVEKDGDEKRDN
jgi:ribosomal protein S27AE